MSVSGPFIGNNMSLLKHTTGPDRNHPTTIPPTVYTVLIKPIKEAFYEHV
jgi:hypothetical protein